MSDVDDLFSDEVDVAPSTASNPRLPQVIGVLVAAGILVALVVVIVVSGLSSISAGRGNAICGGEAVCSDLSLDEVRSLTAIDLPAGSEVVESSYQETDDLITVTAQVLLPDGADDPFEGTGYGTIPAPSLNWKLADLSVLAFYGATGEEGALNAEAVHAINDRVREVVLVQITRALD